MDFGDSVLTSIPTSASDSTERLLTWFLVGSQQNVRRRSYRVLAHQSGGHLGLAAVLDADEQH